MHKLSYVFLQASKVLFFGKRDAFFARMRVLLDMLQTIALLINLSTTDRSWFSVSEPASPVYLLKCKHQDVLCTERDFIRYGCGHWFGH